ncbi:MAG TPA: histidine kinase, partial [Longimicrobiaceae bacterium]|nr:histidine kinase [Longimicrobiaceae bacterium]
MSAAALPDAPGTLEPPPGIGDRLTPRLAATIFGAWLAVLVVSYAAEAVARLAAAGPPTDIGVEFLWAPPLDAALWTLVTLAVLRLTRVFPLTRGALLRHGAVLMLAALVLIPLRNLAMAFGASLLGGLRSDVDFTYLLVTAIRQDLFVYWLTVLAIHAVRHSRAVQEREVARAQLEAQLAQAQLQALKVQIQPHFLFNTLHAIASLVREDPPRAERTVEQLSEMLRTTLTHHQTQEVTLREELETLRPYLEIEKLRLGERLSVELDVEAATHGALVPHLLLQPLVENAIRHGISPRRRPGWVKVEVGSGPDGTLRLVVEDNGRGMSGPVRP